MKLKLKREIISRFLRGFDCQSIGFWVEETQGVMLRKHSSAQCSYGVHRSHVASGIEDIIRDYINGKFKLKSNKK